MLYDPEFEGWQLSNLRATLKYEFLQKIFVIPNVQVITKHLDENPMRERPNSSGKVWMVKTDTDHNHLSPNRPYHYSIDR